MPPPHGPYGKINVRCKFYDDDGRPVGKGCLKSDCRFVHPSDPGWRDAPKTHTPLRPGGSFRGRGRGGGDPAQRDGGWSQRGRASGGGGRGGWAQDASGSNAGQSSASSGWGSSSFGGSGWSANDDSSKAHGSATKSGGWDAPPAAPVASASAAPVWGPPDDTWGAPVSSTSASNDLNWGDWGDPTAGQQPSTAATDTDKKAAESEQSSKAKDAPTVPTPTWSMDTPRSPHPSPQVERPNPVVAPSTDPRKRASGALGGRVARPSASTTVTAAPATASASENASAIALAKDVQEEEMRMLSWGVPAPTAEAGPSGSGTSSKPNPFAFPSYTRAEKMDVVQEPLSTDAVREINMAEGVGEASMAGSNAPSRATSPVHQVAPVPVVDKSSAMFHQWENYVRNLAKAVALKIDLYSLEETRQKQRSLQHTPQYLSASMVAVHAQIEKTRAEHDAKLRRTQKKFDELMERLARFPTSGPSTVLEPGTSPELESVRSYVAQTNAWLDTVKLAVQQYEESARAEAEARREAEQRAKAEAEERAAAAEEARKRVAAVTTRADDLDEKMTDLEFEFDELRVVPLDVDKVVSKLLVQVAEELNLTVHLPPRSQRQPEEGELPPTPPPPVKTEKELAEECERLERGLVECRALLDGLLKQVEDQKARNVPKDLVYHQLAVDNTKMELRLQEVSRKQQDDLKIVESNGAELAQLRVLLQQVKDREPPPQPPAPSPEEIFEQILPIIRPELRKSMLEAVDGLRRGVDEALRKQEEDVCAQVFTACQPAIRVIKAMKNISDRQPDLLMPPPPPPAHSVQH
ncbi:hypothetical protein FKP32DRAFT_1597829 [Trametes sanguinea]|nr:hypothetical protein FKP32DRAFT_1597829 [Trametes sanguinea]